VTDDACRIDVWLWRARFFKTRSLAARIVEGGGVRLARGEARSSVDKPSRSVRCGDVVTFAQGPKWIAVRVEAFGQRRGPATEARALYTLLNYAAGVATGSERPVDARRSDSGACNGRGSDCDG
jgi:ribosome-associated heat shock protein Hsp15